MLHESRGRSNRIGDSLLSDGAKDYDCSGKRKEKRQVKVKEGRRRISSQRDGLDSVKGWQNKNRVRTQETAAVRHRSLALSWAGLQLQLPKLFSVPGVTYFSIRDHLSVIMVYYPFRSASSFSSHASSFFIIHFTDELLTRSIFFFFFFFRLKALRQRAVRKTCILTTV